MRTFEHPHIYKRVPGATHGPQEPIACVLHCTESPNRPGVSDILAIPNFWRLQGLGYNAHCVTDKDAHTVKCALDTQKCWAVAGSNTGRLHLELIGYTTYTTQEWMNQGMREAAKWFAYWAHRHHIPIVTSVTHGMATHAMYSAAFGISDHTDPGKNFPWDHFMDDVRIFYKRGW